MIKIAQDRIDDKSLVKMLCVAYAKELKAYHGYLHAYVTVTGPLESVYGNIYESFMEREMHHLEELGKKIRVMGGMPPIEYPPITEIAKAIYKGYDETLSALQDAEVETLEMYTKIHAAAEHAEDLPLVLLIEEIMQEEEEHHDELERILMDVPKNVERHDTLVVDAFVARKNRLAELFSTPVETQRLVDKYVKELIEINKLLRDFWEYSAQYDDDNSDYDDETDNIVHLSKERDEIIKKLDVLSDDWRRDYSSGPEETQEQELEPALTMRQFK